MRKESPKIFFNHVRPLACFHKKNIVKIVETILDSGINFEGKYNKALEKSLFTYFKTGYVTITASGHDSLALVLSFLKLKKDDEVIIPANSYPTAFPVFLSGAKMVLVDVDTNGQMEIDDLRKKITKKTKAVILVHMYGLVGNLKEIKKIVQEKKLFLIEDTAQAFGTRFLNEPVGTFGDVSCFSLYPTKNLSTVGDGGFIWTKYKRIHEFFKAAKSYGEKTRYKSTFASFHSRLPEIQAGVSQLYFKSSAVYFKKRKQLASLYKKRLKKANLLFYCKPLESIVDSDPVPHLFVCKVKKRDRLRMFLYKKGVDTMIHYPIPIHRVPAFFATGYKTGDFPMSEKLSKEILSFPFHQFLTEDEIEYIIEKLSDFYHG